ncbi:hypothetical protein DUNSADRAFT_4141 [Dunaliella salina]|uniref:Secreted protein n=1 Tax=Dunaliella salina TaxID=3046 RepID=A0ABQ7FUY1_DUNSA|nr:hypothetical protein DUNSADRAFT_4141 [Dunaliella salina]|eukprot:KAF5826209.1 hypothetical protein DUNSADRAFT_4141 [Dunaliella salina]
MQFASGSRCLTAQCLALVVLQPFSGSVKNFSGCQMSFSGCQLPFSGALPTVFQRVFCHLSLSGCFANCLSPGALPFSWCIANCLSTGANGPSAGAVPILFKGLHCQLSFNGCIVICLLVGANFLSAEALPFVFQRAPNVI